MTVIDKIVKSIELHVIHGLQLAIQAQDLVKAYQTSTVFVMSITILQMENYHLVQKLKLVSGLKHLIMWLSTTFCLA